MTRMIDDLGDAVRLESGQLVLHPAAVELGMLAHEAAERAQTQTDRHAIRVALPETPVIGTWDRVRLEEVLDNLIGNAVKYSPDGGEILVEVVASTEEAQLRVVDEGLGIPEADQLRLFERFHRAEGNGLPGLGLGLYITRMLVEAHGGRIDVASVPGEGSAFTVWLPLLVAAEPDAVRSRSGN
jgi:signal transduction histidine kinase